MDFVSLYAEWTQQSGQHQLDGFLAWLRDHCDVTAGDAMTEDEVQRIGELSGATPLEIDNALMESAWP